MPITEQLRHRQRWTLKHILLLAAVPALAIVAFVIMYSMQDLLHFEAGDFASGFVMLLFIILGVGVPYLMLKLAAHETAYLTGRRDKELELKDIPKDKEQLWKRPEGGGFGG